MKNLLFEFSVNKENNTISVKKEFAANLDLVWDAWTKPELLDQWWAPKPYTAKTKHMDFSEGGSWLYAMISPEGETHWSKADYKTIEDKKSFSGWDVFCDENGVESNGMPRSLWKNEFNENQNTTTVNVNLKFDKLEELEQIIAMGFQEGFTMGLGNLDELLKKLQ